MKEGTLCLTGEGGTLTVRIAGDLDHHTAKDIRERIDKELFIMKPHLLILDFSGVSFMDSSGIALIIGRAESIGALGGGLRITGLTPAMRKLIRLSGIEKIKNIGVVWEEVI